jgi:hypothetical protein
VVVLAVLVTVFIFNFYSRLLWVECTMSVGGDFFFCDSDLS